MNRIKELRKAKKMTQVRLSIELEVTQECISAYESGRNIPSLEIAVKMSQLFGVSIEYLMGLSDKSYDGRSLSKQEQLILSLISDMDDRKVDKVISYIEGIKES